MTKSNSHLVVSLAGNVLKASLILFIVSSGLMIYAVADSDLSGNYHEISPNQTVVTSPLYRETGEELQFMVSTTSEEGENYESANEEMKLHVVIERSLTYSFEESSEVYTGNVNQMVRDITVTEPSYYRMKVSNLTDRNVEFVTANAAANIGVAIVAMISIIMFSISVAVLAVTLSLSIVALVLLAMFYPLYLLIKTQSQPRVYYPQNYHPTDQQSSQNSENSNQT
ncbi:MAG: hypothetical protein ACW99A_02085 [Candidatus Kariarchaeaceae archaeon]|jgi:hypothetical protein